MRDRERKRERERGRRRRREEERERGGGGAGENDRGRRREGVEGMRQGELLFGCLTSQQHGSVSKGRICSDKCTRCHTEIDVAGQILYLTKSQYTEPYDTRRLAR